MMDDDANRKSTSEREELLGSSGAISEPEKSDQHDQMRIENSPDIVRTWDQPESISRRDEDSDESTLLDPSTASALETLEQNESIRTDDPDEPCHQRPSYCTGCSPMRILMVPMAVLVFGLIGLTYYAYVIETVDVTIPELVIFHILIALLLG
jgi:hypothetical protein